MFAGQKCYDGDIFLRIEAHAKINLTLEVLARRKDGFHQIRTVLQELELCDILHLEEIPGRGIELACSDPGLPVDEGNLVYRAASLLQERYAPRKGARITLIKRIPVAAGLGGGSSDAAAIIKGLNRLWNLSLNVDTLLKLGAKLGSDVPFFIYGGTCLAEGRGERVRILPPFPPVKVLLAAPAKLKLSAGQVYGFLNLDKIPDSRATTELLALLATQKDSSSSAWQRMSGLLCNHLEEHVLSRCKEVAALKEMLQERGLPALLSGSGPTVFALSRAGHKLQAAGRALALQGYNVILTKTVKNSKGTAMTNG